MCTQKCKNGYLCVHKNAKMAINVYTKIRF